MTAPDSNDAPDTSWFKKAGVITWKVIKWPLIVAVPLAVFVFTAWWSLISALTSDVLAVPDLRGKTVEEARFSLSSRSMVPVISETEKFSQEVDKGDVLETDPPAGAKIKRGRSVYLVLSSGFERILVPNLLQKSVREAELLGEQRGFRINRQDSAYSASVPVGHIIAQDPDPNTAFVTPSVDVLVSRGSYPELIMIPSYQDQALLPVLTKLRELGLPVIVRARGQSIDISNREPYDLRRYTIYRQFPEPGSFMPKNNPETIILRVDRRFR